MRMSERDREGGRREKGQRKRWRKVPMRVMEAGTSANV